ncbi:ATP-binding protein [Roseivivax sediminis]|uniref:Serine/threonine-protein kinase RsbW n=1 Tax=Roseivivax sediminis TaxID=936889 RepID=A0A1I1ZJ62_9RHOB|nr:ATP-binding protein [Roseivivax sediminis]SFE31739.1 serine/threonine-protein kinase RsbW [Roseivivax sediminis]
MPAEKPGRDRARKRALWQVAFRIWPAPAEIRAALLRVEDALQSAGVPAASAGDAALALAEALNNVVEHAFAGLAPGWVTLDITLGQDRLTVRICDRGRPMPGLAAPAGHLPDLDVPRSDVPEGGFGWHLIHSLSSTLDYRREDGANLLRLDFDLRVDPGPDSSGSDPVTPRIARKD